MSKRNISRAEWRKKFAVDNEQRENHQYRMHVETSAAGNYTSNFVDTTTGNEQSNRLTLLSTDSLEQQWEDMLHEEMRKLNPIQKY